MIFNDIDLVLGEAVLLWLEIEVAQIDRILPFIIMYYNLRGNKIKRKGRFKL